MLKNLGRGDSANVTSAFAWFFSPRWWNANALRSHAEVTFGGQAHPRFFGSASLPQNDKPRRRFTRGWHGITIPTPSANLLLSYPANPFLAPGCE